jgi:hypothetical protein
MADHVGRQLQRVEDELRKKKRGLAELTRQNIELQLELSRSPGAARPEPPPAVPPGAAQALAPLMQVGPEEQGEAAEPLENPTEPEREPRSGG